jgi:hypothetical protein
MMKRAACIGLASLALGCGYGFTAGGGALPGKARTLYVPVFRNASAEPGIEGVFTEAFRQELSRWKRLGGEASDARVEGTIVSVQGAPRIVTWKLNADKTSTPQISSYGVQVVAVVRVFKGEEKVGETTVTDTEAYQPMRPATTDGQFPAPSSPTAASNPDNRVLEVEANRRMALRRLAQSLMHQAYQNLTGF